MKRIVKTYPYCDEDGDLLYEVVRYEPKDFRTRRRNEIGNFVWNLNGVRKVLYRLPELQRLQGETIFVCEGEKDADTLAALDMHSTTCQGSVNGWLPEFAQSLKGNRVVILPDNDEIGRKFAAKVAESLAGVVERFAVLELPNLPEKGDVTDWIDAGNGMQDLYFLAGNALDRNPCRDPAPAAAAKSDAPAEDPWRIESICFADIKPEEHEWLWEPLWIDNDVNLLVGLPNAGKTFVACHLAAAVSRGDPWPDGVGHAPKGRVVYLTTENSLSKSIRPRLEDHGADLTQIETWTVKKRRAKDGAIVSKEIDIQDLEPILDRVDNTPDLRLLICDPVTAYMGKAEYMKNEDVRPVMERFGRLCQEKKFAAILLSHTKKSAALAINSVQGAQAYVQVARVVNGLYRDPDDDRRRRRALVPIKNNEGNDGFGRRFSLESCDHNAKRVHMVWDEEHETRSADELMSATLQASGSNGRATVAEDGKSKTQAQFLDVLDHLTKPGDGWVRCVELRKKLGWNGVKFPAVVFDMVRGGLVEERDVDKPLPGGGVEPGGIQEIRRRRHDLS